MPLVARKLPHRDGIANPVAALHAAQLGREVNQTGCAGTLPGEEVRRHPGTVPASAAGSGDHMQVAQVGRAHARDRAAVHVPFHALSVSPLEQHCRRGGPPVVWAVPILRATRLLLELTRNFTSITSRRQQEAICRLARTLASFEGDNELELEGAAVIEID